MTKHSIQSCEMASAGLLGEEGDGKTLWELVQQRRRWGFRSDERTGKLAGLSNWAVPASWMTLPASPAGWNTTGPPTQRLLLKAGSVGTSHFPGQAESRAGAQEELLSCVDSHAGSLLTFFSCALRSRSLMAAVYREVNRY